MQQKGINRKNAVIVLARAPEKGKVKTRLARDLDENLVLFLYKKLVERTVSTVLSTDFAPIVCCHPGTSKQMFRSWLGKNCVYMEQTGQDIGERMVNAFQRVFEWKFKQAALVGTDIPGITHSHLFRAFCLLFKNDVVAGPSFDGGYWLIGFRRDTFNKDIFNDIPWSTRETLIKTREKCAQNGLSLALLEKLTDIDTVEDLQTLRLN